MNICQPSATRQYPFVLGVCREFRSTTFSLTQAPGNASVLAWKYAANAATSLALCTQISALRFFVQSMWLNIDNIMILSSNDSGFCPVTYLPEYASRCRVEAHGNTCHLNCTSRAAKFNVSSNPLSFHTSFNFVAQLLDGSGFEIPTFNVESENTWTFILIGFAAGSLSNVILDQ